MLSKEKGEVICPAAFGFLFILVLLFDILVSPLLGAFQLLLGQILLNMPEIKVKLGNIALDVKKVFLPYIESEYPQLPPSILYKDLPKLPAAGDSQSPKSKLLVAVIDRDPVDAALKWHEENAENAEGSEIAVKAIPVVSMANEERPGGDWEFARKTQEEDICRRSNLARALTSPSKGSHYPIPSKGGIYSPSVGMYLEAACLNKRFF